MSANRCPTCGRSFDPQHSPAVPFCSERCRLVDLGRWLEERYVLPVETEEQADESDQPDDGVRPQPPESHGV